jgi:hypothetical protein
LAFGPGVCLQRGLMVALLSFRMHSSAAFVGLLLRGTGSPPLDGTTPRRSGMDARSGPPAQPPQLLRLRPAPATRARYGVGGALRGGSSLQEEIVLRLHSGAGLADVDRELIERAELEEDEKAALWLFAWCRSDMER